MLLSSDDWEWMVLSNFKYDELSVSNGKIILTIISGVSLAVNSFTAVSISGLLISSATYYISNALAFYSVDPKSEAGLKRRAKVLNTYAWLGTALFICFLISNSLKWDIVESILTFLSRVVVFCSSPIAGYFALKDDEDYKAPSIKEMKRHTALKIEKDNKKKKFANRDRNVKMNRETKEFVLENEDKKR